MNVIEYITEEVRRQGHNLNVPSDGMERVKGMISAWQYAMAMSATGFKPRLTDITVIGSLIEPIKNMTGLRKIPVRVTWQMCPDPKLVQLMLENLCEHGQSLAPLDFYRRLMEIHPFVDGNGRTGKVVLNWMNGSLAAPIFPPEDFWGSEVRG